MLTKNLLS